MNSSIFTLNLILFLIPAVGFSQQTSPDQLTAYSRSEKKEKVTTAASMNLSYEIHAANNRAVKKEKLKASKFLSEIIPGYPSNWFANFVSAEIQSTCNGKSMKATSIKDILSSDQKYILNNADIGADIIMNISYKYVNPATDIMTTRNMNVSLRVVPEIEAKFRGGYEQMRKYLKENTIDLITATNTDQLEAGIVKFTINETGEITNIRLSKSTGDLKIDKLLFQAIVKMPHWKPAETSKGAKVKQEFEFRVGAAGC